MSELGATLARFALRRPMLVTIVMLAITLALAIGAALPTLWPPAQHVLAPIRVDTDPENMLGRDEPVRVFHNWIKEYFDLSDMVVVGVVNEQDPDGVFNPASLRRVHELTNYARTLRGERLHPSLEPNEGVIEVDLLAPSTVDNIESGGMGVVEFAWLMPTPPETRGEAQRIRAAAQRLPMHDGTLVSEDGQALALYLPLTDKGLAHHVSVALRNKIDRFEGPEEYHITGLPVAESTFGVAMFKQMAISAPLAMVVIFLLMWFFFRKLTLILPALIIAAVSAVSTMGLLVVTGNTIHIMSSMIPIFIMPIAVLDAIHIVSEFFDRYAHSGDRRQTIVVVVRTLFVPMLFTSLTTAAGFASLALTPIPPVQVFGLFVAVGVILAWVWTIMFIPAAIAFIPERRLASLARDRQTESAPAQTPLARLLPHVGRFSFRFAPLVLVGAVVVGGVAAYGISRIVINDNPTRWFVPSHPIRVADRVLNSHFGGTYMAYLTFGAPPEAAPLSEQVEAMLERLAEKRETLRADGVSQLEPVFAELAERIRESTKVHDTREALLADVGQWAEGRVAESSDERYMAWDEAAVFVDTERQRSELFKSPEVLQHIVELQQHLLSIQDLRGDPIVGKSNSLADVVRTVHRELLGGAEEAFRIPDRRRTVSECLFQFQSSHRPYDLWHFVSPDYRRTSLWLQLRSGDNRDMERVVEAVEAYLDANPPPVALTHDWFGLTYINVVWQDKMVRGMFRAMLGSFLVVLLMMVLLFRSILWGVLSMVPLTVTIATIYGLIGLIGKDYDMPVAVLSSLSLGLAVDYAIHFIARSRMAMTVHGPWRDAVGPMFGEPARAISRNVVVVGAGFLPLLAAPLMPYKTVGALIATILIAAGIATLVLLPALIRLLERRLQAQLSGTSLACRCATCAAVVVIAVVVVAVNFYYFLNLGWNRWSLVPVLVVPLLVVLCWLSSRRARCRAEAEAGESNERKMQGV
ncbi:MAG: MMPL family transporter [bacterium]